MTPFESLVKVALLGRSRQSAPTPAGGAPLARVLGRLDFLGQLAAAAVHEKAGRLPPRLDAPAAAAPLEDAPRATPAASRALGAVLAAFPEVLPEWLARCAAAGRRARERDLPALLDAARASPRLRPLVLPVLGARGRWLAAQSPAWSWAAEAEGDWETGTRPARIRFLEGLRGRVPDAGRALLESTFADESGEDRAAFVAALATGLSAADEPFLERCLDDRRKEVRRAAAALLVRLPGSRLAARMAARVRACVRGGRVTFPHGCDAAMLRDGVEAAPPKGVGARAFWLFQLVAAAPPGTLDEAPLLAGEHRALFLAAWSKSAALHGDVDLAARLVARGDDAVDPALIEIVPAARREALVRDALRRDAATGLALAMRAPPTLSAETTRAVLAAAVRAPYRGRILRELALRIDPTIDAATHTLLADQLSVLELRATIHREIS